MKSMFKMAAAAAILAFPAMSMAATSYSGTLKASDFKIKGPNKEMWKGQKGVLVKWKVTDNVGSFDYHFAVAGKNNKKLKLEVKRVVVQKQPVAGASAPLSTIGGLTKFETGFKKKVNVSFSSNTAPGHTWLKLKGHGVRAHTRFNYNILPLIDDTIDDGPHEYPDDNGNGDHGGTVVPVPAAAWTGMALLGGMAAIGSLRRKLRRA